MRKRIVPSKGIFIIRVFDADVFHVVVDGKHDEFLCGCNYIAIKSELQKEFPNRKIQFIHLL